MAARDLLRFPDCLGCSTEVTSLCGTLGVGGPWRPRRALSGANWVSREKKLATRVVLV